MLTFSAPEDRVQIDIGRKLGRFTGHLKQPQALMPQGPKHDSKVESFNKPRPPGP